MDARTAALITLYVIIGFIIYVWLAIPPGTGWDQHVHWGDVATWLSSTATTLAVVVALRIANAEARRSAAEVARASNERADQQALTDFRIAVLLIPTIMSLKQSGLFAKRTASTVNRFPLAQKDPMFERSAFEHMAGLAAAVDGLSPRMAYSVLNVVAYSQQMVLTLDIAFKVVSTPPSIAPREQWYEFNGESARKQIMLIGQLVDEHCTNAIEELESTVSSYRARLDMATI